MDSKRESGHAHAGDTILIHANRAGEKPRSASVLEVLGEPGHEHYLVLWDDGHESLYYPSADGSLSVRART